MARNRTLHPQQNDRFPRGPALDYPLSDEPPAHSSLPMWFAIVLLFIGLFLYAVPDLAVWLGTAQACR